MATKFSIRAKTLLGFAKIISKFSPDHLNLVFSPKDKRLAIVNATPFFEKNKIQFKKTGYTPWKIRSNTTQILLDLAERLASQPVNIKIERRRVLDLKIGNNKQEQWNDGTWSEFSGVYCQFRSGRPANIWIEGRVSNVDPFNEYPEQDYTRDWNQTLIETSQAYEDYKKLSGRQGFLEKYGQFVMYGTVILIALIAVYLMAQQGSVIENLGDSISQLKTAVQGSQITGN